MKPTLVRYEAPPFGVGELWPLAGGIGSYGPLGIDYKRRLPALDGVTL
jgi:hypothetical protein